MNRRLLSILLPPSIWLVGLLLLPTLLVCLSGFSAAGLGYLGDSLPWELFLRSCWIAAAVTLSCLLLGYPVAYFIAGCSPRWRSYLLLLILLPFWTNLLVRTYSLIFLLRWGGELTFDDGRKFLYSAWAVIGGLVHGYLPFMVLPLYVSIEKLPKRLLEASRDLGASPWSTFWKVTVPLTMPGIAAGCILVFIPTLGAFVTPEMMGGAALPMLGNQIDLHFKKAAEVGGNEAGAALTVLVMGFTILLLGLYYRVRRTEGLV